MLSVQALCSTPFFFPTTSTLLPLEPLLSSNSPLFKQGPAPSGHGPERNPPRPRAPDANIPAAAQEAINKLCDRSVLAKEIASGNLRTAFTQKLVAKQDQLNLPIDGAMHLLDHLLPEAARGRRGGTLKRKLQDAAIGEGLTETIVWSRTIRLFIEGPCPAGGGGRTCTPLDVKINAVGPRDGVQFNFHRAHGHEVRFYADAAEKGAWLLFELYADKESGELKILVTKVDEPRSAHAADP